MLLYRSKQENKKDKGEQVMRSGYKMSMIKKNKKKDFYGEFETKELAIKMAEDFKMIDSDYVDYEVWYFEK